MHILVADDNADCVATLRMLLEAEGHTVNTACDGQQAVELAQSGRPDGVILDIGMPRLDGFAAAKRIRQIHPGALLVAYTGYSGQEFRQQGLACGFDHYFSKFETGAMLDSVSAAARDLERRRFG